MFLPFFSSFLADLEPVVHGDFEHGQQRLVQSDKMKGSGPNFKAKLKLSCKQIS